MAGFDPSIEGGVRAVERIVETCGNVRRHLKGVGHAYASGPPRVAVRKGGIVQ